MVTMTIGNNAYSVTEEVAKAVELLIMSKATAPVEQPKAEAKPKASKAKSKAKASAPKVLKVDKYGNQWIAEYDAVAYATKKAEMIKAGTYDSKNRSKVYKELGWIL